MLEEKMEKRLGVLSIFCIASGAMISSGLFVLPSVVFGLAGPSIVLAYFVAGLMMIPAMLSQAELATAMPMAGGTYFYIDRSLGSLAGTFAGFANWFAISLKGAFALIGMGAFLQLIRPEVNEIQIKLIAVALIFFFLVINLRSVKESGRIQIILVIGLLAILVFYILSSVSSVEIQHFRPFMNNGTAGVLSASGMIFISYGGLTKVASLAAETKNPGKTLPRGMFLSFFVVNIIYMLSVAITIGLLDEETLTSSYTPLSLGARAVTGNVGMILLSLGAIFSFATTANASILSASRIPLAMSRDKILPPFFGRMSKKNKIPWVSVLFTGLFMAVVILALDLKNLVKVASTMMLLLFFLVNMSVILMRESRLVSYKPQYKSPLYPFIQILGMIFSLVLIAGMGELPLVLSGVFFLLSTLWYIFYCKGHSTRSSALVRIVERVMSRDIKGVHLHDELTSILLDRDNVVEDRFDALIRKAIILDIRESISIDRLFEKIASALSASLDISYELALEKLIEREKESTTVLDPELAIPHIVFDGNEGFCIVVIRALKGVYFSETAPCVKKVFSLAGAGQERNFHLKSLMAIAQIVQDPDFEKGWEMARDSEELRNLILLTERKR